MKKVEFNQEDVWKIARIIANEWCNYDVEYGRNCYNECKYCGASQNWQSNPKDIVHELDCPLLVARDLLTGAPNK